MKKTDAHSSDAQNCSVKLLHIVGDSNYGGGAIIIQRLSEMAKRMGWQVDVLTTDPTCRRIFRQHQIGDVNLDVIRRAINPLRDLKGLFRLWLFLRCSDYDIVHTHTSKPGFIGRLAAKAAGIRGIVHTAHGFPFHEKSTRLELWIYSRLERIAGYACDRIITVSEFHRQWALTLGIGCEEKIVAIPNGLNRDRVKPNRTRNEVRAEIGIDTNTRMLFTTGRLAKEKGLEFLLQALPEVIARLKLSFKLVLAGTGPLLPTLKKIVSDLDVEGHVKFIGFRDDIGDLLAACDITVLPSLHEGLSISLLEALAAGKPIITTAIGSNLEATFDGLAATIVPPGDSMALADAIVQMVENAPLASQKASNAQEIFERHYTEDRMLSAYSAMYSSLLLTPERSLSEVGACLQG